MNPLKEHLVLLPRTGRGVTSVLLGLTALVSLMLTTSCGNLSSSIVLYPQNLDRSAASRETLQTTVEKIALPFISNGTNIGLVVGVLDGDDKTSFGFGRMSLTSDVTPDGDTTFAIGSLTKAILSLVTYQMIEDGILSLSDTLGDVFPPTVELSKSAKLITVGQLLTHSSGLPRQPMEPEMLFSLINYSFTGENIYRHITAEKVFDVLRDFNPDDGDVGVYRYSNMGSAILGRIIELKSQKTIEALLQERIFDRIGARHTSYHFTAEQRPRLATGHVGDSPFFIRRNTPMDQWDMGDILTNSAGLYSTANDLLEFLRYRNSLGNSAIEVTPIRVGFFSVSNRAEQKSSYGWKIDEFADDDTQIIFQYGIISGYSAYIGVIPDKKIGVVVLTNNFNWDDFIGHTLLLTLANRQKTRKQDVQALPRQYNSGLAAD